MSLSEELHEDRDDNSASSGLPEDEREELRLRLGLRLLDESPAAGRDGWVCAGV